MYVYTCIADITIYILLASEWVHNVYISMDYSGGRINRENSTHILQVHILCCVYYYTYTAWVRAVSYMVYDNNN